MVTGYQHFSQYVVVYSKSYFSGNVVYGMMR